MKGDPSKTYVSTLVQPLNANKISVLGMGEIFVVKVHTYYANVPKDYIIRPQLMFYNYVCQCSIVNENQTPWWRIVGIRRLAVYASGISC